MLEAWKECTLVDTKTIDEEFVLLKKVIGLTKHGPAGGTGKLSGSVDCLDFAYSVFRSSDCCKRRRSVGRAESLGRRMA